MKDHKQIITIFLVAILSFLFAGCAGPPKEQTPDMVGTRFSSSRKPPGQNDPKGVKYSYRLEPGRLFTGYYEIDNARNDKHSYMLVAFLDYKQVPFTLNGKKALSHKVSLKAKQKKWWSLEVGPLPQGFHTFSTVLLWDPDYHSLDSQYRFSTDMAMTSTNQANFFVGNTGSFPKPFVLKETSKLKLSKTLQYDGVRINKKSKSLEEWLSNKVKAGKTVDYYIHVANNKKKTLSYSLIALLDDKQINISKDLNSTIVTVPSNTCLNYKTSFKAPFEKGVHELVVIRGLKPFARITNEYDIMMESSIRVPIIVD